MSATLAPFGLRPVRRALETDTLLDAITSGYAFDIFTGDPVALLTNGTIERAGSGPAGSVSATGAVAVAGVFGGVTYTTPQGERQVSPFWPAGTVASNIVVQVWRDLDQTEFMVQANGTLTQAALGDGADFTNLGQGNAFTGRSTCAFGALVGSGNACAMKVIGLAGTPDNAWGDSYPIVLVKLNRLGGFLPVGSNAV